MRQRAVGARRVIGTKWLMAAAVVVAMANPAVNQARGPHRPKSAKLDQVLQHAADSGDGSEKRVIVRVRPGQSTAVQDRAKKRGDRVDSDHPRLSAFTATVGGGELAALSVDPDVESVSIDAVVSSDAAADDGSGNSSIQNVLLASLGLTDARYDGEKVGIAVIDSGLEESEDLSGGRSDRFYDFTLDGRDGHPSDDYGHGTHVATLIAGKGKASETEVTRMEKGKPVKTKLAKYAGLAPKARIISLKVLDAGGGGLTSSVLRRDRVCDRTSPGPGNRRHQSFTRPSGVRIA